MAEKKEEKKKKNEILEELKGIGLVASGVLVGTLIDKGATKVLKLDQASDGLLGKIKPFISPTVRILGGGAGAYFIPNRAARLMLGGVAISGASSLVNHGFNAAFNKSDSDTNVAGIGEIDYQAIDEYRENMVLEDYNPDLPDLAIEGARAERIEEARPIPKNDYEDDEEEFDEAEIM